MIVPFECYRCDRYVIPIKVKSDVPPNIFELQLDVISMGYHRICVPAKGIGCIYLLCWKIKSDNAVIVDLRIPLMRIYGIDLIQCITSYDIIVWYFSESTKR